VVAESPLRGYTHTVVDRSRRDDLLARYKLRSHAFDEVAKRRRRGDWPNHQPLAPADDPAVIPSVRELEVLALMAEGITDSEIAARLSISLYTVKEHAKHLLAKLGARNRAHAVAIGLRRRLIR